MSGKYLTSRIKVRHPALSDRAELLRVMERYHIRPALAAKSMGCSSNAVCDALHKLAPDMVAKWKAEGKFSPGKPRVL